MNINFCKQKNIVVFGLGKAGRSAVQALSENGANIYACDDLDESVKHIKQLGLANVVTTNIEAIDWNIIDFLVLSPGVPLTHPKPHPVVGLAKQANCPIICDVELLYLANDSSNFIGITGTNGKSTTTALISHILHGANIESAMGGNIGVPVLQLNNLSNNGYYVIEMSSYQLDLIDKTRFNIALWLNITADHLDRHGDMQGYIKAKQHIFANQTSDDIAIISIDDDYSKQLYEQLKSANKIGKVIAISTQNIVQDAIAIIDGVIYDKIDGDEQIQLEEQLYLQGQHNAQNTVAAYAVAKFANVNADQFITNFNSFKGLPHRMEYVSQKDGVTYINDSKATNAESASKALQTFDNIYWILGGVAKAGGIESLQPYFSKIKQAYLIGQAADEFAQTLQGQVSYSKCGNLAEAVLAAKQDAQDNSCVILLSPACASFDQWPNFEARGEAFCKLVR